MLELFGYSIDALTIARFKKNTAEHYVTTYARLAEKLKLGLAAHADETKVSIKGVPGYVWAFTNFEDVMYVYTETREGGLVAEMFDGFSGVLVSDFYAAYDGVKCVQQKCLIHLIRDLNTDLFKSPFDEELKSVGREFTAILVPIIETVDRFGLKKRHLAKHKGAVGRFFRSVLNREYTSDVARGYQQRFRQYEDKLFCFLDYDGVPWNNNNAEHAIKRFAFLRNAIGGSSTPDGIRKYLILLSICETLRRKNVSFFRFLVSGSVDIDEFVERQGKQK